jgi:hypothetical protein
MKNLNRSGKISHKGFSRELPSGLSLRVEEQPNGAQGAKGKK